MSHDEFAHTDAAYVLGALGSADRRAYEEHLDECPDCRRSVGDLAGIPGLLAQVEPAVLAAPVESPAVPDTLLPALLREVRRARRRRLAWSVGGAAAATVLAVAGVVAWEESRPPSDGEVAQQAPIEERPMRRIGQDVVTASLSMEEVAWGTRLELTCTYNSGGGEYDAPAPSYALVVRTGDGRVQQVAQWRAVPGRTVTVPAATSAGPAEITAVEVRTLSGRAVLELTG